MQTLVHACLGSWVAGLLDLLGSCVPGLLRLPWVPGLLGCWVARSPGFLGSWVAMVTLDSWGAGLLGLLGSCVPGLLWLPWIPGLLGC